MQCCRLITYWVLARALKFETRIARQVQVQCSLIGLTTNKGRVPEGVLPYWILEYTNKNGILKSKLILGPFCRGLSVTFLI